MTTTLTAEYSNGRGGTLEGVINSVLEAVSYMGEPEYSIRAKHAFKEFFITEDIVGKAVKDFPWLVKHANDNYGQGMVKGLAKELARKTPLREFVNDPCKEIERLGYGFICFHGHGGSKYAYSGFEEEFPNLIGIGYNFLNSIEDEAAKKAKEVLGIIKKTNAKYLALVGHSQGVTMAKSVMTMEFEDEDSGQKACLKDYVKYLINVCGTHEGTRISGISPAKGARDIYYRSGLILKLKLSKEKFNGTTTVIDVVGDEDLLVRPGDSAILEGSKVIRMKAGHLKTFYMIRPILREVSEDLERMAQENVYKH